MLKLLKLAPASLALTLLLMACSPTATAPTTTATTTWSRMESDVIATMDPSLATDSISAQALTDTMDGLYRYEGPKLVPSLATKVVSPTNNGLTYTFTLRNSTWSDGSALTANDFVYSWRRTVNPATKSEYAYLFSGIKNADAIVAGDAQPNTLGVRAVNAHTFEVTMERPVPYFNSMLTHFAFLPESQTAVEKYGAKYGTSSSTILTNGPYTLTDWNGTSNTWTEQKNARYWNASKVGIDTIKVQVVKDPATALNLYNTGKLDDVVLTGQQAAQATSSPDYVALKQSRTTYLHLNETKIAAFKNLQIRQAFSYAIDRPTFIAQVLKNGSLPATGVTSSGLAVDPEDGKTDFAAVAASTTQAYTTYDPAKARSSFEAGMQAIGQTSLNLELLTDDTEVAKQTAEYLQNTLESNLPGLKLTIVTVPFKTRIQRSRDGQFDVVISGWGADFPDPITFLDLFTTGNSYNDGNWSNADYDRLIQASKTTNANDPVARFADMVQAQTILTEQQGAVPLYQQVAVHLRRQTITGLTYSPASTYNFVGASLKNN